MVDARPPSAETGPAPPPGLPPWLAALLLSLVLVGACKAVLALCVPAPGEAWILRWLRLLAAHPTRSTLACALLFASVLPRRKLFPSNG